MAAGDPKPRPCLDCKGRRLTVVKGQIVPCETCKGTGAREVTLRLFEPIMESVS
jgi:DnaJ-class molecular chaperone